MELFKVSRYRPSAQGPFLVDLDRLVRGGSQSVQGRRPSSHCSPSGTEGGTLGNVYAVFEKKDGSHADKIHPDPFPEIRWVRAENGSRETGDMEDRAAKFLLNQNLLLIMKTSVSSQICNRSS